MIVKTCGTCKHYMIERKTRTRTKGKCLAPIPDAVYDYEMADAVFSDGGKKCPAWGVPVPDSLTYVPGGKPAFELRNRARLKGAK